MTYKLLGANVSPFVRKVRVLLAEKGIAYDFEPVSPFAPPPNWRDVSPLGKIPAFMDGDKVVNDSTVICQYIERKNKAVPMLPADDDGYIRALWLEEYIDGGFVPVAGAKVFFPLIVAPLRSKAPPDAATRADAAKAVAEELPAFWAYMEAQLGDRQFFVNDTLTLADIAIASMHVNLLHAQVQVDAARFPRLAAFMQRMFARPSFKALIEEEAPMWTLKSA
ncbi:MAG: glutathione S-transferase family protein [Proteobacteria bacterium]|jgi:glutathione S-transferase|nr:glutathione S-transferase family protein [Pseudomonadota bacterium]